MELPFLHEMEESAGIEPPDILTRFVPLNMVRTRSTASLT